MAAMVAREGDPRATDGRPGPWRRQLGEKRTWQVEKSQRWRPRPGVERELYRSPKEADRPGVEGVC